MADVVRTTTVVGVDVAVHGAGVKRMKHGLVWSYGRNKYDVMPSQHAGSLRDFTLFVRTHRSPDKANSGYVTAPLLGRRLARNVQARNWLALDVDRIDAAVHTEWRLFIGARFLGLGWPTASSTPEEPRERVIAMLDQELSPGQALGVGRLLIGEITAKFGTSLYIDESTLRPGQPAYLPLTNARGFYLLGDPVNTEALLARIPHCRKSPATVDEFGSPDMAARWVWIVDSFRAAEAIVGELDGKGYAVRCPWAAEHSVGPSSTSSSALLQPSEENGHRGAFRCLHSHCARRSLESVVQLLQTRALTLSESGAP